MKTNCLNLIKISLFILLTGLSQVAYSQSNEDCLTCHSDNELSYERKGKELPLFVNEDTYTHSVHADIQCIDCHTDFNAEELPHKTGNEIYKVDCSTCHDTEAFKSSIHAKKNIECFTCHSKHEIQSAESLDKDLTKLCVNCHKSETVDKYIASKHYTEFNKGKNAPSCYTCHDAAHNIKSADFSKKEIDNLCSTCHGKSHTEFAKSIHFLAKEEGTPTCIDCHGAHHVNKNKYTIASQGCLSCHLDKKRFENIGKENLVAFVENYKTSTHANIINKGGEAATCIDCHDNHMIQDVTVEGNKVSRESLPNTCGKCHNNIVEDFTKSIHGKSLAEGMEFAPTCTDCHGEHNIESVDISSVGKIATKEKCMDCHVKNEAIVKAIGSELNDIIYYEKSAHYLALLNGNKNAPTCSDCHGAHLMSDPSDPNSKINKVNEAETCGQKGCHPNIAAEYKQTIHGQALAGGNLNSPSCTDCHGKHQIIRTDDPESKVAQGQNVAKLCSDCHSDVELVEEFNLPTGKTGSYFESFHGLAVRGGSKYAADCASCHGTHNIRPSSDPLSTVNKNNLSETCGTCHPGANIEENFGSVHLNISKEETPIQYYIEYFYIGMIILVIGGMLVHNILDVVRKTIDRFKYPEHYQHHNKSGKVYLRMSKNERIQHFIMLTSFIALVISGFGLKYPDAFWVEAIRYVLGDGAFELRGLSHRIFGIMMILVSLYHLYYILFTQRGRQMVKDFLPAWRDINDIKVNLKWITGLSKEKPRFERFSYMEKAEYWALIWGVIVMGATGLMLMFNDFFLANFPYLWLDIATLIHLYEAWLATLAIIVWHFYYVIFNPDVYPLNTALITGTLTEEQMEHEHADELERIKKQDKA
ncbi:MAG: cytochrome c3 family protein [Bacteroidetes bacterium]|nr:cytochrome c3 family protein [Bacteroidota bacterium]